MSSLGRNLSTIVIICGILSLWQILNSGVITIGSVFENRDNRAIIAAVVCEQRLDEVLVMIKSALIFHDSKKYLKIIIIAEDILQKEIREHLDYWQKVSGKKYDFEVHSLMFPANDSIDWKHLFKPCASQRLFLPTLLPNEKAVLYLDTDTLFLSPVWDTWIHFLKFNETQIAAVAPEHEDANVGWYNRFARHPFYGQFGINSGVMLMNLTRMREFNWEEQMASLYRQFKLQITWGDQDLINILFHFHPDKIYVLSCEFNYRPDHCMYLSVCNSTHGARIIHGNRGYFHSKKQLVFKIIYDTIDSYNFDQDPYKEIYLKLENLFSNSVDNSNCGKVWKNILARAKSALSGPVP